MKTSAHTIETGGGALERSAVTSEGPRNAGEIFRAAMIDRAQAMAADPDHAIAAIGRRLLGELVR